MVPFPCHWFHSHPNRTLYCYVSLTACRSHYWCSLLCSGSITIPLVSRALYGHISDVVASRALYGHISLCIAIYRAFLAIFLASRDMYSHISLAACRSHFWCSLLSGECASWDQRRKFTSTQGQPALLCSVLQCLIVQYCVFIYCVFVYRHMVSPPYCAVSLCSVFIVQCLCV